MQTIREGREETTRAFIRWKPRGLETGPCAPMGAYCFERNSSLQEGSLHNCEFLRQGQEKSAERIKQSHSSAFVDGKVLGMSEEAYF